MTSSLFQKVTNFLKKRMISLKSLKRKNHKMNPISLFLIILNLTPVKSAELQKLIFKKNSKNWCHNLWKRSKNLFLKNLTLAPKAKKLFTNELLVMSVESMTLKESDINALFVLISTYVKIVKLFQATVIPSLKLSIQNKLLTKSLLSFKMIMKIHLSWMDIEFNYHNFLLWINCLMLLEDLSNLIKEDLTLDLMDNILIVLSKEILRKRNKRNQKRKLWYKNLKRKQKSKKKSLLKKLSLRLKWSLQDEFSKSQLWNQKKLRRKKMSMRRILRMPNIFSKYYQAQSKKTNALNLPESIPIWQKKNSSVCISLRSIEIFDLNELF